MVKYGRSIYKDKNPINIKTPENHLINTTGEINYWVNFEKYITAFWRIRGIDFDL